MRDQSECEQLINVTAGSAPCLSWCRPTFSQQLCLCNNTFIAQVKHLVVFNDLSMRHAFHIKEKKCPELVLCYSNLNQKPNHQLDFLKNTTLGLGDSRRHLFQHFWDSAVELIYKFSQCSPLFSGNTVVSDQSF